jgi:hypothetical protein
MKYDVEIPKSSLHVIFLRLIIIIGGIGLISIGHLNSPVGENGLPRLLSPRLAQITSYQHDAQHWTGEIQEIQSGLSELLANQGGTDLLSQDGQANLLYGRLATLQAELDGTKVPPTLGILHDAIQDAVNQSMLAASRTIAWISEPTTENQTAALNASGNAASALEHVNKNPWIQEQP